MGVGLLVLANIAMAMISQAEVPPPYGEGIKRSQEKESGYDWMGTGSSGLMQPLWALQPNIYNSGITRGRIGPEAAGDPNGSITANRGSSSPTKLLTTYSRP